MLARGLFYVVRRELRAYSLQLQGWYSVLLSVLCTRFRYPQKLFSKGREYEQKIVKIEMPHLFS